MGMLRAEASALQGDMTGLAHSVSSGYTAETKCFIFGTDPSGSKDEWNILSLGQRMDFADD